MGKGLTVDGQIVEVPDDMFDIVNEITSRWPNLWVQYANPEHPTAAGRLGPCLGDAPFRIMERTQEGPKVVFSVWQLDQSVIDRLHLMNAANIDVFDEVEKHNAKLKADLQNEAEESFGEGAELHESAIKHFADGKLKFKYKNEHGEKRVISEDYTGRDQSRTVL